MWKPLSPKAVLGRTAYSGVHKFSYSLEAEFHFGRGFILGHQVGRNFIGMETSQKQGQSSWVYMPSPCD